MGLDVFVVSLEVWSMRPQRQRSPIRPKISTMPRQQTEAGQYLDMYKLTVEKTRLSQELASIEQRRQQINTRLAALEQMVETMEQKAQNVRIEQTTESVDSEKSYKTLYLDY
ncbi:MAG: hypothetical protein AAFU71_08315 [Cyanobacteria bacterium J06632_22]